MACCDWREPQPELTFIKDKVESAAMKWLICVAVKSKTDAVSRKYEKTSGMQAVFISAGETKSAPPCWRECH